MGRKMILRTNVLLGFLYFRRRQMIALGFGCALRVDRVLRCLSPYVKARPIKDLEGQCPRYSLCCSTGMDRDMKRKVDMRLWRPVSTQAHSIEVVTEDDSRIEEMHSSKSSLIRSGEEETTITEIVSESAIGSTVLEDDVKVGSLKAEITVSAGKHLVSLNVGTSLFRFIQGKGGSTQKKIEEQMGVKIIFPSAKKVESITIEGNSVDSVTRASEKIQSIIDEAVKSPSLQYSHFISLPLAIHPELVDKLITFQNFILGNSGQLAEENMKSDSEGGDEDKQLNERCDVAVKLKVEDGKRVEVDLTSTPLVSYAPKPTKSSKSPSLSDMGIDKSIFIKPKAFHLTLLMLKLWNKERVNAASEVLKSVSPKVMDALGNRPLFIRLRGLDCLKGSLAKARVLYVPVEEIGDEGRILRAAQVITNAFVEAGLVLDKDANNKLKLHATVMNTSHRRGKARRRKDDSFDARGIFEKFGSEEWGQYLIREAHLSQRFLYDENGYYHCCASIPFPESKQGD